MNKREEGPDNSEPFVQEKKLEDRELGAILFGPGAAFVLGEAAQLHLLSLIYNGQSR